MSNHIKIYGVKPRIQYVANGTLTEYEFPFAIFKASDIDVYFNDKLQDQSDYTVTTVRDIEGGSVIFETAPINGTVITIVRNLSIERTTDFQEGGALRAKVLNDELDYQIACQQQIADNLNRSMVMPPYAIDSDVDLTLPTPSAGRAIVWNSEGTNLENSAVKVNELESTMKGYKESAESSATIATEKASIASDKADIASAQAQIATGKADEAKETLNAKANKDMDNLSTVGKASLVCLCVPDLSRGISKTAGTQTSPNITETDCMIVFSGRSTSTSGAGASLTAYVGNNWVQFSGASGANLSTLGLRGNAYLPKGTQYYIDTASFIYCYEFPLKGAE